MEVYFLASLIKNKKSNGASQEKLNKNSKAGYTKSSN